MTGSGFEDILIEAELISSGSLKGVMNGKHFERSMHCHKIMYESLHRLLLEKFMIDNEESEWYSTLSQEVLQKLDKLLQSNFPEFLKTLLTDTSLNNFMNAYLKFQDEIRDGKHGKLLNCGCLIWIMQPWSLLFKKQFRIIITYYMFMFCI